MMAPEGRLLKMLIVALVASSMVLNDYSTFT